MPRIGTVIRDVYRRPGSEALPLHLERLYGIRVTTTTRLDAGVFKVEQDDGPAWVARLWDFRDTANPRAAKSLGTQTLGKGPDPLSFAGPARRHLWRD